MAKWIGHNLHITEGRIASRIWAMRRQGRRCKQIRDDREETRGYWKLKGAELQGGARNDIPLIIHITHFYCYKSI